MSLTLFLHPECGTQYLAHGVCSNILLNEIIGTITEKR